MNDANKNLQELTQKLEAGVQELFAGEKYQNYLNAMAKFHQYSFRNSILIFLQNPDATRVAGFNAWKALGRSVNKGEHGLQILAPAPYKKTLEVTRDERGTLLPEPQKKEITVAAFCPAYVFDISQTTGKELPTLATQLTGAVKKYDMLFHSLLAASPCPIAVEPIENGADS
ncbi:MAG: ArdC family protein [Angelakisella sp.]